MSNIFLQKNIDITQFSNFKTPAKARYFFGIQSENDIGKLKEILEFAEQSETSSEGQIKDKKLPILFIGGGTNMLFAFDTFEGIVIKNSLEGWNYDEKTKKLETYSNEPIWEIAEKLETDYNQDLWHRFIGLPGSIGGAIFGNAGCFGLETENNLVQVKAYNLKTGQIEFLGKEDCKFAYRNSIFKNSRDYFIISASFDLSEKVEKYHSDVDNIYFREYKQPAGNTCGSFFKNPKIDTEKFLKDFPQFCEENVKIISAGFLLEKVGLKGFKLGGAYFSELHSNFLMHDGDGNYKDLLDLIQLAQNKVQEKFGIHLDPEVRIVSSD